MRPALLLAAALVCVSGFAPRPPPASRVGVRVGGAFDFLKKAFENEDFDDRRAKASHILARPRSAHSFDAIDPPAAFGWTPCSLT